MKEETQSDQESRYGELDHLNALEGLVPTGGVDIHGNPYYGAPQGDAERQMLAEILAEIREETTTLLCVEGKDGATHHVNTQRFQAISEAGEVRELRQEGRNPVDRENRRMKMEDGESIQLEWQDAIRLHCAFELQKPMIVSDLKTWDRFDVRIHEMVAKPISRPDDPIALRPDQYKQVVRISADEATLQIYDSEGNREEMPIDKQDAEKLFDLCQDLHERYYPEVPTKAP